MTNEKRCNDYVSGDGLFYLRPCGRRALPGKDKCGIHDLESRQQRRAKRGPTKFERELAAAEQKRAEVERLRAEVERLGAENAALRAALEGGRDAPE